MKDIKPYDNYKKSGIDFLGDIPGHWKLLANKHIFRLKKNTVGKRSNQYDLLSLTLGGIIKRDMENPQGKFPAEFDTYQEVKAGDFVFCLFDVEETPRTVGLSDFHGMITGAYTVFECRPQLYANFLYYFFLRLDQRKLLKPLYRGLRNTIPKESFFSFKTFVPPLSEQTLIAHFLDHKTTQIDRFIQLKEKTIALLEERKAALINQAVTKGLDPTVPMKDSGIEWLGEIPAHWEVKKLKYLVCEIQMGPFGSMLKDIIQEKGKYRVYGQENIINQNFSRGTRWITQKSFEELTKYRVNASDLLLTRKGSIGNAVIANETIISGIIDSDTIRVRVNHSILNIDFAYQLMRNAFYVSEQIESKKRGAVLSGLNTTVISQLVLVIPSIREQKLLLEKIEVESNAINKLITKTKDKISLLSQYRESLISSAVTGKIDLRQYPYTQKHVQSTAHP